MVSVFPVMSVASLAFAEALAAIEQHHYGGGRSEATVLTYTNAFRAAAHDARSNQLRRAFRPRSEAAAAISVRDENMTQNN